MDQHLNNTRYDFLWTLLANPANKADLQASNLQQLVNDFPQSGILQALLVCNSDKKNLKRAAVYFNGGSLYKLLKAPAAFSDVPAGRIVIQTEIPGKGHYKNNGTIATEGITDYKTADLPETENYFSEQTTAETEQHNTDVLNTIDTPAPPDQETEFTGEDIDINITDEYAEPLNQREQQLVEDIIIEDHFAALPVIVHETTTTHIVSETSDEDLLNNIAKNETPTFESLKQRAETGLAEPVVLEEGLPEEIHSIETTAADLNSETDKLIVDNIAATDYFMFDKAFGAPAAGKTELNAPVVDANPVPKVEALPQHTADPETEKVSKYHDDKMPYSFMWWLDKTRKEHTGIYQPYAVEPTVPANNTDDKLEQQYFENIFHITPIDELEKTIAPGQPQTVEFDMKRKDPFVKEHVIIDRFLKEEPQIKPQSGDKLGNENKAKKSSEDKDDEIITETLATIYVDQMLYHKAIAAYKKLMLKLPEKSVYFAEKIEQLEKKTN